MIAAGQRVFGENRVQEATGQMAGAAGELMPTSSCIWSGRCSPTRRSEAVALFDAIHSVDRASLCEALGPARSPGRAAAPLLFAEINTGGEPQKSGVLPQDADDFLKRCRDTYRLSIAGLMCLPPVDEPPAPHFALTAKIARRNGLPCSPWG